MFGIHDEDLVAGGIPFSAGSLKYKLAAVKALVGLCIVTTKGQLFDVGEVFFLWIPE